MPSLQIADRNHLDLWGHAMGDGAWDQATLYHWRVRIDGGILHAFQIFITLLLGTCSLFLVADTSPELLRMLAEAAFGHIDMHLPPPNHGDMAL